LPTSGEVVQVLTFSKKKVLSLNLMEVIPCWCSSLCQVVDSGMALVTCWEKILFKSNIESKYLNLILE
jgi:hypothetical protein